MSDIKRFTLDANIDGMDQVREFVLASDYDARVHDLETMCDPAGLTAENALLRDQTRMLDAMIGRLKSELQAAAPTQGADARPVAIYQEQDCSGHWIDIPRIRYNMIPNPLWKRIVYTTRMDGDRHE